MTKLNRKLEYALMALKVMSQKAQGELTTAKEVVDLTGCPFDATARVLQVMAHHGLLKSEQGAHGGYLLIQDLSRVSFYDLSHMILGPLALVRCLQDAHGDCELVEQCNIQSPLQEFNRRLRDFYKGISLKDLLRHRESADWKKAYEHVVSTN